MTPPSIETLTWLREQVEQADGSPRDASVTDRCIDARTAMAAEWWTKEQTDDERPDGIEGG